MRESEIFDMNILHALAKSKAQIETLKKRLQAMGAQSDKFNPAVYKRVESDYQTELEAAQAQAAPLQNECEKQFQILTKTLSGLLEQQESATLDKQEAELRHLLGELDEASLNKRVKAIDNKFADNSTALEQAQMHIAEFSQAGFRADSALATKLSDPQTTNELPQVEARLELNPIPPIVEQDSSPHSTIMMPAIDIPDASPSGAESTTQVFRAGQLTPLNIEAGKQALHLGVATITLGTDPTCQAVLLGPGIDAHHAQIIGTPDGYLLKDMNSQYGTRINAERIEQQLLKQDDVIQIGAARFAFRAG